MSRNLSLKSGLHPPLSYKLRNFIEWLKAVTNRTFQETLSRKKFLTFSLGITIFVLFGFIGMRFDSGAWNWKLSISIGALGSLFFFLIMNRYYKTALALPLFIIFSVIASFILLFTGVASENGLFEKYLSFCLGVIFNA